MSDELKINRIDRIPHKFPKVTERDPEDRNKQHQKQQQSAKDNFERLAQAAEDAHEILVKENSPYRFCVYWEGEDVFIDVVILNKEGKIKDITKKKITHDEFTTWLAHIERGRGLLIDETS